MLRTLSTDYAYMIIIRIAGYRIFCCRQAGALPRPGTHPAGFIRLIGIAKQDPNWGRSEIVACRDRKLIAVIASTRHVAACVQSDFSAGGVPFLRSVRRIRPRRAVFGQFTAFGVIFLESAERSSLDSRPDGIIPPGSDSFQRFFAEKFGSSDGGISTSDS